MREVEEEVWKEKVWEGGRGEVEEEVRYEVWEGGRG